MFKIVDNLQAPASATTRTRTRGEFHQTVDSLAIGQGFEFDSKGTLKSQYPRIAPKKFGGTKRFRIWAVEGGEGAGENGTNVYAVRREADKVVADVVPGVNTVGNRDEDEGGDE